MTKMTLSEDARTDAEEEGYLDGMKDDDKEDMSNDANRPRRLIWKTTYERLRSKLYVKEDGRTAGELEPGDLDSYERRS